MNHSRRRFLHADDFNDADDPTAEKLFETFQAILKEIIQPALDVVYPEFTEKVSLDDIFENGTDETVVEFWMLARHEITLEMGSFNDISDWTNEFAEKKQQLETAVRYAFSPTLSDEMLHKHGLSEEQFIVSLAGIDIQVYSAVLPTGASSIFVFQPMINVFLRIEDISGYEPEGIEARRLRYNNLCISELGYPEEEVRNWARSLGIPKVDQMSKVELCALVKKYYEF